jgi:hypothetical protein
VGNFAPPPPVLLGADVFQAGFHNTHTASRSEGRGGTSSDIIPFSVYRYVTVHDLVPISKSRMHARVLMGFFYVRHENCKTWFPPTQNKQQTKMTRSGGRAGEKTIISILWI